MAFFNRNVILVLAASSAVISLSRQKTGGYRPLAKSAIRAGLLIYEQARETLGVLTETASDLVAEARAELEEERRRSAHPHEDRGEQVVPFATRAAPEFERKING